LWWGVALVAVLVVGTYLAFGGTLPGSNPRELRILTSDAGMLRPAGAIRVRVSGVDVGHVTGIRRVPDRPGLSEVTARLADDAPVIRRDATVKIRPRLFLEGNFFLDVAPGTPGAEPLGDRPLPPAASTIHVAADEVFSAFDAEGRRDVRGALRGLGGTVRGRGPDDLRRLVRDAGPALSDVAIVGRSALGRDPDDLRRLVRDAARVLDVTARQQDDLRATLAGGRRTAEAVGRERRAWAATIGELDETTHRAPEDLAAIRRAMPEARALVRDARPLLRRLPPTLRAAVPAVRAASTLLRSGDVPRLTAALRPASDRLADAAAPLAGTLGRVRPLAVCLRRVVNPALLTPVQDGHLSTGLPPYRELLSAGVGLASAAQSFDGLGHAIRYNLGLGNQLISMGAGSTAPAVARAEAPLLGSRPPKPARRPPLRSDVPCETQAPQDLATPALPFKGTQRSAPLDQDRVTTLLRTLAGTLDPAKGEGR